MTTKTATKTKAKRDRLSPEELQAARDRPLYMPGDPYMYVMSYGWVLLGFYVCHETPLSIRLAHANFVRVAGTSWAEFATQGATDKTEWIYLGNWQVTVPQIVHSGEYQGEINRGHVRLG